MSDFCSISFGRMGMSRGAGKGALLSFDISRIVPGPGRVFNKGGSRKALGMRPERRLQASGEADGSRKTLTDEDGKSGRSDLNDQLSQY